MWRDLTDDEIKYFNKLVIELKGKIRFHGIIMIISYVVILLILLFTGSFKLKYTVEVLEILSINPFMWIFIYIFLRINDLINCLSVKGYTKCKDVRILDIVPEDSSKYTSWFANVKISDTGEVVERLMCHNGEKIRKLISEKGLYEEAILIDLKGHRQEVKNKNKHPNEEETSDDENLNEFSEAIYSGIIEKDKNNDINKKEDISNYMVYDLTNL